MGGKIAPLFFFVFVFPLPHHHTFLLYLFIDSCSTLPPPPIPMLLLPLLLLCITHKGKTVCLLSLITSYQFANPSAGKLVYCTRTVPEMNHVVEELNLAINYQSWNSGDELHYMCTITINRL